MDKKGYVDVYKKAGTARFVPNQALAWSWKSSTKPYHGAGRAAPSLSMELEEQHQALAWSWKSSTKS